MRWILAAALGVAMSTTVSAQVAEPLTIYTGGEGGGYDRAAQRIAQRLQQRGVDVVVENLNGSDEITLNACSNPNSVWIAQKDALYVREINDGCVLVDLDLYGTEVATIWFPPDSRLNELSDLDEEHTVLVDRLGSGTDLFWRTIKQIEVEHGRSNDWINAQTEYGAIRRATSMAARGNIHALILVRTPNSADFARLVDQGWELGDISDRDINDLEYGSRSLYERVRVEIGRERDHAYAVPSFIGTSEQIERSDPDLFDMILSAIE